MRGTVAGFSLLFIALLGVISGAAGAARSDAFEIKGRTGSLGRLARIVADDGGGYVSAARLAALLNGSWSVKDSKATLTVGRRSAQFVKNQRRIIVAGEPLTLDTAARNGATGWLIPEDFLTKGLSRLAPGITAAASVTEPKAPPAKAARADIALQELRYRSYPSFTRIVVETGAALTAQTVSSREEIRVQLPRLAVARARGEEIGDGLVREVRLEPNG